MDTLAIQVVPVSPSSWNKSASVDRFWAALNEIIALSGKVNLPDAGKAIINLGVEESTDSIEHFRQLWHPSNPSASYIFLTVSADSKDHMIDFQNHNPDLSEWDKGWIGTSLFDTSLSQWVADLLFASQIAAPGAIGAAPSYIIWDDTTFSTTDGLSSKFNEAFEAAQRAGWPPITDLSIWQVLDWLYRLPGFNEGIGRGPVGRAVAALSYLMDKSGNIPSSELALIWAVLGLEAIYGRESVGTKSQLLQKSEVILGKRETHKKILSRIYDLRSRFLHGDLDFPLNYNERGDDNETLNFYNEQGDAELFATSVLISTIQWLVQNNLHSIGFSYVLSSSEIYKKAE